MAHVWNLRVMRPACALHLLHRRALASLSASRRQPWGWLGARCRQQPLQQRLQQLGGKLGSGRQRGMLAVAAGLWGFGGDEPEKQQQQPWEGEQAPDRRMAMLEFVQQVEPGIMQTFEDGADPQVVTAMRQTITNILGTLPPQFFRVTISTAGENLAQLMYSVIMTGYMFRNAWYRLELKRSLGGGGGGSLPAAGGRAAELVGVADGGSVDDDFRPLPKYAPGSQKRGVSGDVVRWIEDSGPEGGGQLEVTPAAQYIELLEREVASLRAQVADQSATLGVLSGNELMDYLKTLTATQLTELTARAGDDVLEAMNTFVQRLMATDGGSGEDEDWKSGSSDCTAVELAQLLYWVMVVGFQLRSLEVRLDMRSQFESALPPGASRGGKGGEGGPPGLPPGRW